MSVKVAFITLWENYVTSEFI